MSADEYQRFIGSAFLTGHLSDSPPLRLVIVHEPTDVLTSPGSHPFVLCVVGDAFGGAGPVGADLVVSRDDLDAVRQTVAKAPITAISLALHLRVVEGLEPELGLAAESAVYSMTQSGEEFAAWRSEAHQVIDPSTAPRLTMARTGGDLDIVLDRPERHNAIDARMRDELCDALTLAVADDSIEHVRLAGNGPSFCSGGDLGEFGSRSDPAGAHTIRLTNSPARLMHRLAHRTTVHIHGATLGGGIEMAAFAHRVIASADTVVGLPEVGLGLIPGAGGTVSMTRRIGRQRTAALALTGRTITARTALEWGLVDEVN